jgi:hypothetical protein
MEDIWGRERPQIPMHPALVAEKLQRPSQKRRLTQRRVNQVNQYGKLADRNLRENLPELRQKLSKSGKLEQFLENLGNEAEEQMAFLRHQYLQKHPLPKKDWKNESELNDLIHAKEAADRYAREIVMEEIVLLKAEPPPAVPQAPGVDVEIVFDALNEK